MPKIKMSFWTDNKVTDDFTPEDRYFFLYLLTNSQTNLCGCYRVNFQKFSNELGYSKTRVEYLIKRFDEELGVIRYSETTGEIMIRKWYRYNWSTKSKFKKALFKEIRAVEDFGLKILLLNLYFTFLEPDV